LPDNGSEFFFAIRAFDLSGNQSDLSEETSSITTDILLEGEVPVSYSMEQNYPNPFNPSTNISYRVPENSVVEITLYDMLGRKLSTLLKDRKAAGSYQITVDMSSYASGVYLYRMKAGSFIQTRRLTLIK